MRGDPRTPLVSSFHGRRKLPGHAASSPEQRLQLQRPGHRQLPPALPLLGGALAAAALAAATLSTTTLAIAGPTVGPASIASSLSVGPLASATSTTSTGDCGEHAGT